jgi:hypothetical protein
MKGSHPDVDYFAVDIASEMLASSSIPFDRRFVGTLSDVSLPVKTFDYVFLLGVTTYIGDEELKKTLASIHGMLSLSGRAIITFTNRSSVDWLFRRAIKKLPGIRRRKGFVLSQDFPTYARSMAEIVRMVEDLFTIQRSVGLNHTVFPFNQLLQGLSVGFARRIHRVGVSSSSLLLSSDILIEVSRK